MLMSGCLAAATLGTLRVGPPRAENVHRIRLAQEDCEGLRPRRHLAGFTVGAAAGLSLVVHFDLRLPNFVGNSLGALIGVFLDDDLLSDPRLLVDHSLFALPLSFDGPL